MFYLYVIGALALMFGLNWVVKKIENFIDKFLK
jgi:hypothetical protein